eukprot:TRINITY_DN32313_c0_g1_i1.p1 TRINITY_DN32313_c0_g1~~TRINITY_DN32313_c0_g1_i1.p1  ORF type:complete len:562 (-),score=61.11 TRINITY_DN32313_c0_g1_i1:116-1801(-)
MPIDINSLRADRGGDPEAVRRNQQKRFKQGSDALVDELLALDKTWREQVTQIRELQTRLNKFQREVIAPLKKNKAPCDAELAEAECIRQNIQRMEADHVVCEHERDAKISKLGNIVDESVPCSLDEADSLLVHVSPMPELLELPCPLAKCSYPLPHRRPLMHDELLWRIGGYDPERGSKVAGTRGYFLYDVGVLLNQALINFAITFLRSRGYKAVQPPYFMKKDLMAGIAQLSDFDEQLYKVSASSGTSDDDAIDRDRYLIATSEQPLCALHAKEILDERELPLRYAGVSTCFRKEVGKANKDNRGIFRVHQFEKIEQFCITSGSLDESRRMHEEMLRCTQDFHEALGISFRVVNVVSGELNDAAAIKYDLEGWFPGLGQYRELVSCSNCTDFQSRALDIRCKNLDDKANSSGRLSYVHMLNSTLTATGRSICCILETYQTPDGVRVPDVLVPFMGGLTFLPFVSQQPKRDRSDVALDSREGNCAILSKHRDGLGKTTCLEALEAKLLNQPYINGFFASASDLAMLNTVEPEQPDPARFPNVCRWLQHVNSFTPSEQASWR